METPPPSDEYVGPWIRATRTRFFWLLIALIGFILVAPVIPPSPDGQGEVMILSIVIFFSASYVSHGLSRIWAILLLCAILAAISALFIIFNDPTSLRLVLLFGMLGALIYSVIGVLTFVLEGGDAVGIEHIYGAVCAYVLIAMTFATLYFILESLFPGSFSGVQLAHETDRPWWQFFYFSFSTLSTVGYGDIVAVTLRARSFVVIEQLFAVFYVAILISRLTGMYTTNFRPRKHHEHHESK